MIYIVGFTFIAGRDTTKSLGVGSVLQQLNENKAARVTESPFSAGLPYKVVLIKPVIEDKRIASYLYQFTNEQTGETVPMTFTSPDEADVYIARISGTLNQYRAQKEAAARAEEF